MPNNDENKQRPIRSFVRRQGRMTPAQRAAFDDLWEKYGIDIDNLNTLDLNQLFKRNALKILEIGFGMGEALIQLAQHHPEQDFLGIDVHRPGVGAVLMGIEKNQLMNVRVLCADAVEVLNKKIVDSSFDGVHLFFPDPWPKKRHHKRRLVTANFAELIRAKLKLAGYVHIATDWENYAEQILDVMTNAYGFINRAGRGCYSPRPESRPLTRFEQRGERLGHKVWDLIFVKEV